MEIKPPVSRELDLLWFKSEENTSKILSPEEATAKAEIILTEFIN